MACDTDSAVATKIAAGAPDGKIKITEAMVEAGIDELRVWVLDEPYENERAIVRAIFVALISNHHRHASPR